MEGGSEPRNDISCCCCDDIDGRIIFGRINDARRTYERSSKSQQNSRKYPVQYQQVPSSISLGGYGTSRGYCTILLLPPQQQVPESAFKFVRISMLRTKDSFKLREREPLFQGYSWSSRMHVIFQNFVALVFILLLH